MSVTRSSPAQVQGYTNSYSQNPKFISNSWALLSMGDKHAIGIKQNGTLWGWGDNTFGQLGINDTLYRSSPVQVTGGGSWRLAEAGISYTVAIKGDDTIYTWGVNSNGQLGLTDTVTRSSPAQIPGASWISVSAGQNHVVAIKSDYSLWGWGTNDRGQIGNSNYITVSSPVQISASSWTTVHASRSFTSAIDINGRLFSWGDNTSGRLGYYNPPTNIESWIMIAGNDDFTVAIKYPDYSLWSWGTNATGQLGDNTIVSKSSPVQISTNSWIFVSVNDGGGGASVSAIRSDGTLWSWGSGANGLLGVGDTINRSSPVQVSGGGSWSKVNAGKSHKLAIKSDGSLWSWGAGATGQLGIVAEWSQIAPGLSFTAGIDTAGRLFTWGLNSSGQLGIGSIVPRSSPVQVGSNSWSQVATGGSHVLAIDSTGALYTWGGNSQGELGDGTIVAKSSPVKIGSSSWSQVAANTYLSAGITSDGRLFGWGNNINYTIGDSTNVSKSSPTQVTGTNSWIMVSLGGSFSFGIKTDRTLWAWGYQGAYGFLGDGITGATYKSFPQQIGTSSWLMVDAGAQHTVAITTDYRLWAWGFNGTGQLGDNTLTSHSVPTLISTSSWVVVAATVDASSGITSDGRLFIWGNNNFGQLGDNTTINKSSPILVKSGTSFALTAGAKNNNIPALFGVQSLPRVLWAWGPNGGAFGDNTTVTKSSPVLIASTANEFIPKKVTTANLSFTNISASDGTSYAIDNTNRLWATGINAQGQIGDNTVVAKYSLVQVGASSWTSVFATNSWVHAITTDGRLHGWGLGTTGQLGYGDTLNRSNPIQISSTKFSQVAGYATTINTMALDTAGGLWAWGAKSIKLSTEVNATYTYSWSVISTGVSHSIAVRNDGRLFTWGSNTQGQLGIGSTIPRSAPTQINATGDINEFWLTASAGGNRSYAIRMDNTLWSWGDNTNGMLGAGDTLYRSRPVQLAAASPTGGASFGIGDNATSTFGSLSVPQTGTQFQFPGNFTIECWVYLMDPTRGPPQSFWSQSSLSSYFDLRWYNSRFQVSLNAISGTDLGGTISATTWTHVALVRNSGIITLYVNGVSTGTTLTNNTTLGYVADGFIGIAGTTQGNAFYGYIYDLRIVKGTAVYNGTFTPNRSLSQNITNTVLLTARSQSFTDYSSYSWTIVPGSPTQPLTTSVFNIPAPENNLFSFTQINAGLSHTIAVTSNNSLYGFGDNTYGQIGYGGISPISFLSLIASGSYTQISAGGAHNAVIKSDGSLWTWGANDAGQLGTSDTIYEFVKSSAGTSEYFITNYGTLFASGNNTFGQLGLNNTIARSVPTQVGANSWTLVSGGYNYCMAIKNDGTLWAWGVNDYGQLGLNDLVNRSIPVQVGTSSWSTVSASGWGHTMGITVDGKLYGWGDKSFGKLGISQYGPDSGRSPILISTKSFKQVSAGLHHTLMIDADGYLYSTGQGTNGVLGTGDTLNRSSPTQLGTKQWKAIAAGNYISFAIDTNNYIFATGDNTNGALGIGDTVTRSFPTQIGTSAGSTWDEIATTTGAQAAYAIRYDKTLWSWGIGSSNGVNAARSSPVQLGTYAGYTDISAGYNTGLAITLGASDTNVVFRIDSATPNISLTYPIIHRSSPTQVGTSSWTMVSAGDKHTFAIDTNGNLYAMGSNRYFQIGNTSYTTVLESNNNGQAFIKSGDGSLWLWGDNQFGQLGINTTTNRSAPVQIGFNSMTNDEFVLVSRAKTATTPHALAIDNTGALYAWGVNTSGKLGTGDTLNRSSPVQLGGLSWLQVATGPSHSLAIKNDGTLWGWGLNTTGQAGLVSWTKASVGISHTLALKSDGTVYAWGANNLGQLGDNTSVNKSSPVTVMSSAISVVAGLNTSYAIKVDGSLWSWGSNASGNIGINLTTNRSSPVQVGISRWTSISGQWSHAVGIMADGSVWTWGLNNSGQLGQNDTLNRSSPVQLSAGNSWIAATAGNNTFLTDTNYSIWGMGWNADGQLGTNDYFNRSSPTQVVASGSWSIVSSGFRHTLGIKTDGSLWSWGSNLYGPLGLGAGADSLINRSTPVQVTTGPASWTNAFAGMDYSLAVDTNNLVYAWGSNDYGRIGNIKPISWLSSMPSGGIQQNGSLWVWGTNLGDGTVTNKLFPVQLDNNSWVSISGTPNSKFAIRSDRTLYVWGDNGIGQLGTGDTVRRLSPVQLAGSWSMVACAPAGNTYGIRMDGTLWSWGNNGTGQLGYGLADVPYGLDRSSPVQIGTDTWKEVAAGGEFAYAIKSDSTLWTWGLNWAGQAGGNQVNGAIVNWTQATGGQDFNGGILSNGGLQVWGNNSKGQLGTGDTLNRSSPVNIGNGIYVLTGGGYCDGAQQYFNTPASANLALGAGDFTIEMWFNVRSKVHYYPALIGNYTVYAANSWGVFVDRTDTGPGRIYVGVFNGSLGFAGSTYIEKNRWYHVAVTRVGGTCSIWLDGQLDGQSTVFGTTNIDAAVSTTIYMGRTDTGTPYNGMFSNVRIIKGQGIFTGAFTPSTVPLTSTTIGHTGAGVAGSLTGTVQLLTMQNNYAKDNSANNFAITAVGGAYAGPNYTPFRFAGYDMSKYQFNTITAGISHMVGIATNGTIWAWGDNTYGQLSDGTTISRSFPVQVGTTATYTSVVAGGNNTWFITDNSNSGAFPGRITVAGAGYNSLGTLGLNDTLNRSRPVQLGTDFRSIVSSATGHTLAIKYDYSLWAWGTNTYSELGLYDLNNYQTYRSSPVQVGTKSWKNVSAGNNTSLGIDTDNKLYAWGYNNYGQLGLPASLSAYQLASTSLTRNDGALFMVGPNQYGQIGDGTTINRSAYVQIGSSSWISVASNEYQTIAVRADGTLWAWGDAGPRWWGDAFNKSSPVQIGSDTNWRTLSMGYGGAGLLCVVALIKNDGTLYSMGPNDYGQLGTGDTITRSIPIQVGTNSWSQVSVGVSHALAIATDGTLWSWGGGTAGALGLGDTVTRSFPTQIGTANNWSKISGQYASFAINSLGQLWAWGHNTTGSLGLNISYLNTTSSPQQVGTSSWSQVAAWWYTTAAIDTAGRLFTWGFGNGGYLGTGAAAGSTINRSSPVQVGALTTWSALAQGGYGARAAIATATGQQLWAWGGNAAGRLGDSSTITRSSPVQVATYNGLVNPYRSPTLVSSSSWTQVNAGTSWSAAIRVDGGLFTWGYSASGEAGQSTIIQRSIPTQVGTSSWTQISGNGNPIGRLTTNGLFIWGSNLIGQIGDNTTVNKSSPVGMGATATGIYSGLVTIISPMQVGTSSWSHVATGDTFGLMTRIDGTLWGMGTNAGGTLGLNLPPGNAASYRSSPTQIGTSTWTSISAGWYLAGGVLSTGAIYMWGNNSFGQLGTGNMASVGRSSPVQVGALTTWNSLKIDWLNVVAGKTDGTIWGWGLNEFGRLGISDNISRSSPVQIGTGSQTLFPTPIPFLGKQPAPVAAGFNGSTDYITTGTSSQLTLTGDFTIEMNFLIAGQVNWPGGTIGSLLLSKNAAYATAGNNNFYILANHSSAPTSNLGKLSVHNTTYGGYYLVSNTVVCDGQWHHMAIVRIGTTVSMYVDGVFQMSVTNSATWDYSGMAIASNPSDGGATIAQLASSAYINSLRIVNGIGVYTGNFTPPTAPLTVRQSAGTNISAITGSETAFLTFTDSNYTDKSDYNIPLNVIGSVMVPFSQNSVKSIGGGEATSMVINDDGWIWGTGLNNLGQLGTSTTNNRSTPVQIQTNTLVDTRSSPAQIGTGSWSLVSAGADYSMGLKTDGTLWVWGNNAGGQLGIGTTVSSRWAQVQVPGSYAFIAAGTSHSAAIDMNDTLFMWGYGGAGMLGLNDTLNRSLPVQVDSNTWSIVSLGLSYSVGLDTSGTAYGWGVNSSGQLGDNTLVGKSNPTQVYNAPVNYSLAFNGTNSYVTVPTTAAPSPTGDFTIECWFNLTSYPTAFSGNYAAAICSNWPTANGDGFEFTIYGPNGSSITGLSIYSRNGGVVATWTQAIYAFQLNTWYHVALVKSGTNGNMFINGVSYKSFTYTTWGTNTNPLRIGAMQTTNYEYYFPGYISNFRITTSALYSSTFIVPNANLPVLANTTVLLGQSSTVKDNSINNYTVTVGGAATVATNSPFAFYSGVFNKTNYLSIAATSNLLIGTSDFTIEAWVYIKSRSLVFPILSQGDGLSATPNWFFGVNLAGALIFDTYNNNVGYHTTTAIPLITWTHVALVRNGSSLKFYLNGVDTGNSFTSTTDYNNLDVTRIGRGRSSSTNYADGYISNLRFVVGKAAYTGNFTPILYPLSTVGISYGSKYQAFDSSYTKLLLLQDATIVDKSLNNFSITNVNSVTTTSSVSPYNTTVSAAWDYIQAGTATTMGIRNNQLYSWGDGSAGMLGDNTIVAKSVPTAVGLIFTAAKLLSSPTQIGSYTNKLWNTVAAGGSHTYAVATDYTLYSWGNDAYGQLGDLSVNTKSSPTQIPGNVTSYNMISAGYSHTNLITTSGTVIVVGLNNVGQLGENTVVTRSGGVQIAAGTMTSPLVPMKLNYTRTSTWTQVQNGAAVTLIKNDGTIWSWGNNTTGQMGLSDVVTRSSAVQLGNVIQAYINSPVQVGYSSWSQVALGPDHALGRMIDGTLWSWGNNNNGQLGDNSVISRSAPNQISTSSWATVAAGESVAMGILGNSVFTWGYNANYALGTASLLLNEKRSSPVQIGTVPNVTGPSINTSGGGYIKN